MDSLTQRQAAVTTLHALGMDSKQIAAELGIAVNTARITLQQARERVGAKTVAHLVAISITRGFINVMPAFVASVLIVSIALGGCDMARRGPRIGKQHRRPEYVISV